MRVAALQYTATDDLAHNCTVAHALMKDAAAQGARFICLPECANLLAKDKASLTRQAEEEESSLFLAMAIDFAKSHQVSLSLGSLMMRQIDQTQPDQRIANRHYLINPQGQITARYDKIHMFDADVNDGQTYRESDHFCPGTKAVMSAVEGHKIGLSICYDIRFAALYHHYAKEQADLILTPAAFTKTTGSAHWHILQRARAIETGAFIIAAAQKGIHDDGRETYGHALIVNPWGEVIADAGPTGDMALATLDFNEVDKARSCLSAWRNQSSEF